MNKTLLAYLLIVGISGTAGAGTGVVLKRTIGPVDEKYPPGFSPEEYRDPNIQTNVDKYKSTKSLSGMSDSEIVNVGLALYKEYDNSYWVGSGDADAGITVQTVRNGQIKRTVGGVTTYFEEQISNGMIGVAKRTIQDTSKETIDLYTGNPKSATVADYGGGPQTFDRDGYRSYLGKVPEDMFIYVISDKTTKSSSLKTLGNGDIEINLELDTNISTYYYKIQMQNISGLSNYPPFTKVNHTYTFSKDMVLKKLYVDENYTATKEGIPVPAATHNTITYYYYAGGEREIPQINEPFDYTVEE